MKSIFTVNHIFVLVQWQHLEKNHYAQASYFDENNGGKEITDWKSVSEINQMLVQSALTAFCDYHSLQKWIY